MISNYFYDGYKRSYTIGGTWRMNEHLNLSLSDSINDIDLPSGSFTTHLVTGRSATSTWSTTSATTRAAAPC